ncbi:SF1B family DNA helicase RecD2 [Enterococcus saccharolyticus]|uniref:ATP-dependent RecD2 DNA helicase n=1 Tax=Enterococcus saccharolyticus subsp. saccharolyticus ATCC 43076 TaxID=1139996 RepID=S0NHX4_9ENTE|nr:ATP-dependent RecD-like DNA helicase [Enterococcus saccharolyticus]EOT28092.1 RecD/TraA family helicase [Enterococcus saccharolyticus subsp. saccharolyticus ATCC 43076]EOT77470.1 RecD/TraA family helicase [Enterococcus saccharolyticus subsp. saccharolyticus ATCC 43076]OJG90757.1 RecD/TraA family helicase [Enterococcus saccharolyticus]
MLPEKTYVVGKVAAIFFQNPSNFFKVLLVRIEETNAEYREKEIVVTGSFGEVQEEESYRFFGEMVEHPKYGEQLKADTYQKEQPTSENGLIHYLSSEKFPGIGKKTAERIVDLLGEQAIDRMIAEPELLGQVPGLTEKKQKMMLETIRLNYGMDQVIVGLNRFGFGSQLAFAIYQAYKNTAIEMIEENPYRLVEDIEGIGFKKADNIAEQLGIEATSPKRMRAAILHQIFQQSMQTGNTYVPAQELLDQTIRLLETSRPVEIHPEQVADVVIQLVDQGKIQQEGTNLYENSLFFSEWGIATSIQRLLQRKKEINYPEKTVEKCLRKIEKRLGIVYGSSQEEAIKQAIRSPLFILTGGPGTGKTTVINGIVQLFAELNEVDLEPSKYTEETFPILLAAPTGRAAKRMNETTGLPSGTIHRLLGLNGREKATAMAPKELEGGLLIVDEMSMVDTWLANTLFKSISTNMQVIFVGDKDQLPSVGPGQVLHDLLEIDDIPKQELNEIYRQGDGSSIIPLAHEIKNGRLPQNFTQNQKDRSFFACDAYKIEPIIAQIVQRAKDRGFTPQDIQVLAPMYRGAAGIDALNKMMQEIFNPNPDGKKKEVHWNETVYRIGDKVLQLVNSPEDNVFNGDMGQIVGITYAKNSEDKVDELTIQFDANEVTYKRSEWNKITLSYCCSIHKSQGSEFKMVILPMVHQYQRMLQRNLLYTAITRSKELLILLGELPAYQQCVANESNLRYTTLKERILGIDSLSSTMRQRIHQYEEADEEPFAEEDNVAPLPIVEASEAQTSLFSEEASLIEEAFEQLPEYLTEEVIQTGQIDPMIGMAGISPYDFQTN